MPPTASSLSKDSPYRLATGVRKFCSEPQVHSHFTQKCSKGTQGSYSSLELQSANVYLLPGGRHSSFIIQGFVM
jgi:hypothetical protein